MAELLTLRFYPDAILRKECLPVTVFDNSIKKLSDDMLFTMYASEGVGLAAPQVGHSIRMFVLDVSPEKKSPMVFVNPIILENYGEKRNYKEGCLSFPNVFSNLTSYDSIWVQYQDAETGDKRTHEAMGLEATCIQHEIDHLNGVLMVDRMGSKERAKVKSSLMVKK